MSELWNRKRPIFYFDLKIAVGSWKSSQPLDAPRTCTNWLITHKVTTQLFNSLCTAIACTAFRAKLPLLGLTVFCSTNECIYLNDTCFWKKKKTGARMIATTNSGKLSIQLSRQLGGVYNCACFGAFRTTGFLNVLILCMHQRRMKNGFGR